MSTHTASIAWSRQDADFARGKYGRTHTASFDGGVDISVTTALPLPSNTLPATDPEEMVVAALASCHMMFFLDFARRGGFIVDTYDDVPKGTLGKDEAGKDRLIKITLSPQIMWSGDNIPGAADIDLLHFKAHEICYIGQSLKCPVVIT
jgi:organic hydroperoxide reductase OsmC/OhrA